MSEQYLKDTVFLKQLDKDNNKVFYVKILVLDKNEIPIRPIEGRVSTGSISINGSSNVRRAGSITFLAEEVENDLTDIDNLLSMNKKIKILIGLENNIDRTLYEDIIWFNQGTFVITNPSLQHSSTGVTISLQFKDKMCLLNGECGGMLPTSVTFHEYEQMISYDIDSKRINFPLYPRKNVIYQINKYNSKTGENEAFYYMYDDLKGWEKVNPEEVDNGEPVKVEQRIFDIIQTVVSFFGNENIAKIIINDVPLSIKQSVRYLGDNTLYFNASTGQYSLDENFVNKNEPNKWESFTYNEDCGYMFVDFVYPGELISGIGETVTSVLDKICSALGNYEYFYDIEGNFIFQQKRNYLNTQYDPVLQLTDEDLNNPNALTYDKTSIINADNYYVDFNNSSKSIYTFEEGSTLITAYSNTPNYLNIKNDYHIWGKQEGKDSKNSSAIHYHLVIKEKPQEFGTYKVICETDIDGNFTGKVHLYIKANKEIGTIIENYKASDWRAELYLRGLDKQSRGQRPDIYEQEILDFWDSIYNMKEKKFKVDIVKHPNDLKYWIDYIVPNELFDISVDTIGTKMYTHQQDKIKRLYNRDIPNVVMISDSFNDNTEGNIKGRCEATGQKWAKVSANIYENVVANTIGYSAQEVARDLLYQYTNYASSISLTTIPIYYLDVNNRITVTDRAAGIYGDYVINSINLPLDAKSTMSIQATRALERI